MTKHEGATRHEAEKGASSQAIKAIPALIGALLEMREFADAGLASARDHGDATEVALWGELREKCCKALRTAGAATPAEACA